MKDRYTTLRTDDSVMVVDNLLGGEDRPYTLAYRLPSRTMIAIHTESGDGSIIVSDPAALTDLGKFLMDEAERLRGL